MFCNQIIKYSTIFLTVCNLYLFVSCDEVNNIVKNLNALLRFPGWGSIDHVSVKYQLITNEFIFFSGKDVFIPMRETNSPSVDVYNFITKYQMTILLLGCVYVNAVLDTLTLVNYILNETIVVSTSETKANIYRRKKHKDGNTVTVEELDSTNNSVFEIFDFALSQLIDVQPMFERIRKAFIFLSLNQLGNTHKYYPDLKRVINSIFYIRRAATDLKNQLGDYNNEHLKDNLTEISLLRKTLSLFLKSQTKNDLLPFANSYCQRLENSNETISTQKLSAEQTSILNTVNYLIQNHIGNAIQKYVLDLGLDNVKEHTSSEKIHEKKSLANTLNTILSNSGWSEINHLKVRHLGSTKENDLFSGNDLMQSMEEPDRFIISDHSVEGNHWMPIELLGCVYANTILELLTLIHVILRECENMKRREKLRVNKRKYRKNQNTMNRERRDDKSNSDNFDNSSYQEMSYFAFIILTKHDLLFNHMHSALYYLVKLYDLFKIKKVQLFQDIQLVLSSLSILIETNEIITDLNELLLLKTVLNTQINSNLVYFTKKYCVIPGLSETNTFPGNKFCSNYIFITGSLITKHTNHVIKNYFLDLGLEPALKSEETNNITEDLLDNLL